MRTHFRKQKTRRSAFGLQFLENVSDVYGSLCAGVAPLKLQVGATDTVVKAYVPLAGHVGRVLVDVNFT